MTVPPTGRTSTVFTHGVASGDPDATGVVLWTRAVGRWGRETDVEWSVRTDDGTPVRTGRATASAEHDHTCRVVVDGLEPDTPYRYGFECDGERVDGRTRTLPGSAGRDSFRFAVACCSRWGWPGFDAYEAILGEGVDLVVHLGDYVYEIGESTPEGGWTDPPYDCVSLDDYRRRYRQHRSHRSLQRLHAELPVLAVWDDHEVVDNAPDEESHARRQAGQQAWTEWLPTRAEGHDLRLDRRLPIGGLVDLVLVDSRFGGRPAIDTDGPAARTSDHDLLDGVQWSLLERAAAESEAPWFVVANQVQVSPLTLAYTPRLGRPPWRRVVNPDQWDGFPRSRDRLVQTLDSAAGQPVLLSGDLHAGWSRDLIVDERVVAHEFTSPSISGSSFARAVRSRTGLPRAVVEWIVRRLNPGIDHVDLQRHGYLVCEVTRSELRTTFVHHDGTRVDRTLRAGPRGPGEPDGSTGTLPASSSGTHRDVAQSG